ncbi:peptidoglycan-associated lipoprotein Pal [Sphingoaurantiacus capsulatus]|uniref:Peptidoglycan-associated lipoprotein n=1 Tax=Sphingoaurantiacus capsulatus TaxID=1771310 RepID=A0ABV7X4B0_9SPHN
MRSLPLQVLLITGLVATAACSKKKEDLPPPPPPAATTTPTAPTTGETPGPVSSSAVPGSAADFQQQAGDRVYFAYDSYELDEASRGTLNKQATWLQRYGQVRITVEGHADERGTREYNLALGDRRANAVKNHLAAQGVGAARISTISYGKERPEVQGSDEESFAQNRRGVTVISGGAAS